MRLTSAPERLNLLMSWLTGKLDVYSTALIRTTAGKREVLESVHTDYAEVRRATNEFINSFDGSQGAGFVEFVKADGRDLTNDDLDTVRGRLQLLLEQGFNNSAADDGAPLFSLSSTAFAVRNTGRRKPETRKQDGIRRVVSGGARAQREFKAAGAYVLQVHSALTQDVIVFLAAHLLLQQGMTAVFRCKRYPRCDHFLVKATAQRGAPQQFCSTSCRVLHAEEQSLMKKGRK